MNAKLKKIIDKQDAKKKLSEDAKKKFGEVFTPKPLVDEMLSKLPEEVFINEEKTFMDPSCGDGAFLKEVLKLKIKNGIDPIIALSTIFGIEIQANNHLQCQKNLMNITMDALNEKYKLDPIVISYSCLIPTILGMNIICADALTYDYSKFENTYLFVKDALNLIKQHYEQKNSI